MATNTAAWITAAKAYPFEVKSAPLVQPSEGEILVRNHAVAINPLDGKLQQSPFMPLNYPTIFGHDTAGEVISVGPGVTRFSAGDRVVGQSHGMVTGRSENQTFQLYSVLSERLVSPIPADLSFEQATVLPTGVSTASSGLFQEHLLNLRLPTESKPPAGQVVLVWGGAGTVGLNAVQLATAAGYEVVATASPRNFELLKSLGAKAVFDYKSGTVTQDLLAAVKGKTFVGAFEASGNGIKGVFDFVSQVEDGKKLVASVVGFPDPPAGVTAGQVFSLGILKDKVSKAIWEDFLPTALKEKTYTIRPEPLVVGEGLESIQGAVDVVNKGVSAQKVVVTL